MKRKIKILHIQETIASGGVERRRLSLAKLLDKSKFEQKVICQQEVGNIGNEIRNEGVEVICLHHSLKSIFDYKQHQAVQKIIEEYKPDIIHGAVFEGVTMAVINGWYKRVPKIIIEETSDPQNRSWRGNLLIKIFSFLADRVIGVSESVTEEYLKAKLGVSNGKVLLINNGVALPREVSENEIVVAKQKWGIEEGDFVIGSIGRMKNDHHKRYSDMIKAFALFANEKKNVKLLLIGGNSEFLKKYRDLVDELKIKEKVIFTEYQSDVTLFYKMMDVFSLVSAYEAFGLVVAEAMLNKLPVVATKVGGMKYIVDDQKTGFLVIPFDITDISSKYDRLYNDHLLKNRFGDSGYLKALNQYTEDIYVQKIADLYNNVLIDNNGK